PIPTPTPPPIPTPTPPPIPTPTPPPISTTSPTPIPISTPTPTPIPDTEPTPFEHIYEEPSPVQQHLSKVASLKPRSIDKGRRYKRRKEAKGQKVVSSLDSQEEVDTGAEQVNTAEGVNTGSIKLSTVSE
ncbi:hypothetical protein Tco_0240002, partial [Tanacetum coccineum]